MSIDAMRQALEALEMYLRLDTTEEFILFEQVTVPEAITALRAAIEQANEFNPDWDAMAVMVEEQQRMARRIAELEAQQKPWVKTYSGGQPNYTVPPNRTPVAWRKHYENSGYTYYDARWKNIPPDAEPLYL